MSEQSFASQIINSTLSVMTEWAKKNGIGAKQIKTMAPFLEQKIRKSAPEASDEAESDEDTEVDDQPKGKKPEIWVLLHTRKTPTPQHGVVFPDGLKGKVVSTLGLESDKTVKLQRTFDGFPIDEKEFKEKMKLLKTRFSVVEKEFIEAKEQGLPWVEPKGAKAKTTTKGKKAKAPQKDDEDDEVEVDDAEVKPNPKGKGKTAPKPKGKKLDVADVEEDPLVLVENEWGNLADETHGLVFVETEVKKGKSSETKKICIGLQSTETELSEGDDPFDYVLPLDKDSNKLVAKLEKDLGIKIAKLTAAVLKTFVDEELKERIESTLMA